MSRNPQKNPCPPENPPQRQFGPRHLKRALKALDLLFQQESIPPEARFRSNRLIEELAHHDISPALAEALLADLVKRQVFRRGCPLVRIVSYVPFEGEQTSEFIPDSYLHTTPVKWFDNVNRMLPGLQDVRPSPKRASRAAKIELLTRELRTIVRAAREHAVASEEQTGVAQLLPRPTQKQLAALTGLSTADVSRCLQDQSARELRILWDAAADLDKVQRWHGRGSNGDAA